jgi:hypothetical protein
MALMLIAAEQELHVLEQIERAETWLGDALAAGDLQRIMVARGVLDSAITDLARMRLHAWKRQ